MTQIYNRHDQLEKRRILRAERPPAERILWQGLRGKRLAGYKFRRQYSVGPYVIDFYCPDVKLAVEVDGPTHEGEDAVAYDVARQKYIEACGIRFVRVSNADVYRNLDGVLLAIEQRIPPPNPLLGKEGETIQPSLSRENTPSPAPPLAKRKGNFPG